MEDKIYLYLSVSTSCMKKEEGQEATKIHIDIILQIFESLVSLGAVAEVASNAEKQLVVW